MASVPDPAPGSIHQLEVGLVNQGGGVASPARSTTTKLVPGQVPEFLIQRREKAVPGLRVSLPSTAIAMVSPAGPESIAQAK